MNFCDYFYPKASNMDDTMEELKEVIIVKDEDSTTPKIGKRKRTVEDLPISVLAEVFLRVMYPLSTCLGKALTTGLVKPLNYSPTVMLHQGSKMLMFSETAWDSFVKHLHLIECYLTNRILGRKANARLLGSDIEIDVVKQRGDYQVRFRNLTKHDDKVFLTRDEFFVLSTVAPAVTRYMKQLTLSEPILRDYLIHTMETQPDVPILYSPIDTSIFNRIPYEVEVWRKMRDLQSLPSGFAGEKEDDLKEEEEEGESVE